MKGVSPTVKAGRSQLGQWRRFLDLGAFSLAGVVSLNVLVIGAVAFFLWQSHEQATDAAVTTTQNLARLLDDDLSASFDRVESVLFTVAEELEQQWEDAWPNDVALSKLIARQRARVPSVLSVSIIGADGWVGPSDPPVEAPVSLADRDYFIQLRQGASTIVTKPVAGRVIKTMVVVFGHRLADSKGAFAGAVIATVELAYLAEAIARPDVGQEGIISLMATDSTLLARKGPAGPANAVGQTAVSRELQALREAGQTEGSYQARSPVDGIKRRHSFRRIGRFPFYVIVGMAPEDYLLAWRRSTAVAIVFLLAFVALTSLGTLLTRRMWRQVKSPSLCKSYFA